MIDIATVLVTVGIITVEIFVLVILYRNYITNWNAEKWQEKAQDGDWMVNLLSPVIDTIVDESTDSVINKMKMELLSGQGQLSRAALSEIETPEEMMMKLSGELLKSVGLKNTPAILQVKMAQGLGGLISQVMNPEEQQSAVDTVKVGAEMFNDKLF
jgi:hypothetical protein